MNRLFSIMTLTLLIFGSKSAFALTRVPLELDSQHWHLLEYHNIPANRVSQNEGGIRIDVQASASPLIYTFEQPQSIRHISVSGKISLLPAIPEGAQQGDRGADDFPFRLGLVLEGDKNLTFAQRLIASDWVKQLFDLAPESSGIDQVRFLNLRNPAPVNWQQRIHPESRGLFTEVIVGQADANMRFELEHTLDAPLRVLALWISADGDDTGSFYSLTLDSVSYN